MSVYDNKFLKVSKTSGVRLTPLIEPVIIALDKYFEQAGVTANVTSGERTSGDQLRTIRTYCVRYKVDVEYPEILNCGVLDRDDEKNFKWQKAWSKLLSIGVIINPPLPAVCLFDYMRNGVNKKGERIGYSPHYYGKAFDIGGGIDHNISNELPVIEKAFSDKLKGMKGYLPERKNNCIHIDCV